MNRKILPAMIGAIVVGGMTAAQADVQVFGHLDQSFNYIDGSGSPYVDKGDTDWRFQCTTCSIGFKGSEDLGNGLKAIFKLDFQFDMNNRNTGRARTEFDTADVAAVTTGGASTPIVVPGVVTNVETNDNSSITDRDQWVGLASNYGKLRIGTISTTYKSSGAMLDPGYRTIAQMRDVGIMSKLHSGAGSAGQGRAENTARYDSPSWNGLSFAAQYTLVPDDRGDDDGFGGGIKYENGGILLFADYISSNRDGDDEAYKAGGKWAFNNFAIFGQYEYDAGLISRREFGLMNPGNIEGDGANNYFAGASYAFGNNLIYAAVGRKEDSDMDKKELGIDVDDETTSGNIVMIHSLSKRTLLYGGFVYVEIEDDRIDDDNIKHYTLGVKHKF